MKFILSHKKFVVQAALFAIFSAFQLFAELNEKPDSPTPTADTIIPKMFIGIVVIIVLVGVIRIIKRFRDS